MLLFTVVNLLSSNAVTLRRDKSILFSRFTLMGLILISYMTLNNLFITALSQGIGLFGGLFNLTTFTQSFNLFIFFVSSVILTLTSFYPRKAKQEFENPFTQYTDNKDATEYVNNKDTIMNIKYNKNALENITSEQFRIIEYPLIIIFIISGAVFLISTGDLISVFLAIELQSYGLYILSTLYRDSESATASGLTYFLLGGLSSCFILFGSALLYANSGTTNLDNIYVISSISQIHENSTEIVTWYDSYYIHLSLIILSVGFLFKISAAPFHFWSPDVYDGIPTVVTTFVAIVPKISIFAFFLELVYYTQSDYQEFTWKYILLLSSLFSLIIGSVLGLTQSRIKRLFAYSTISHVGFILLALGINNVESIQAYIFYILQYSVSNLNAFIILLSIGYSLFLHVYKGEEFKENFVDKNNSPIQLINQIKGYFYINHFLAVSLAITLFSFVGVPPLMGFFAKQMVLSAALDSGHVFMALVAILTSVIGAAYYLNLINHIFFYKENYEFNKKIENNNNNNTNINKGFVALNSSLSNIISILTLLLVLFIYIPGEWFNIASIITLILFKS